MSQSEGIQYGTMTEWKGDTNYWNTILKDISFNHLFENLYQTTPDISRWEDLQFIGGFDLPQEVDFDLINPDNIFKRLYYLLGDENVIAVSL